ncbi:cysteine desulfurase family protein [Roseibium album]|uniref:cysteine desulfurase family protein n=1 Tax=Roseibium album TaxID=311410 RepID=UPI003BAE9205
MLTYKSNIKPIYFDNNASTPLDPLIFEEMLPFFKENFGNPHSTSHAIGWSAAKAVETAAGSIATLIGCDLDEVFFTSGATESNNIAIAGLARGHTSNKRKIVTTEIEHKSTINICRSLEDEGFETVFTPVDNNGRILLDQLFQNLNEDVLICSFSAVNSEIGTIQEIDRVSDIARSFGVLMHWDAAQAPGIFSLQKFSEHTDLISLSAHKMYGPQGIGAIRIAREIQPFIKPLIQGGGQQDGIRPGTLSTALCVGMGHAARIAGDDDLQQINRTRISNLRNRLVEGLTSAYPSIRLNGPDYQIRHSGNANICFPGINGEDILAVLQPRLAASTGSACTSGIPEPSHVLRGIGLSQNEASSSVRFCLGRFSNEGEVEIAIELISNAIDQFETIRDVG